MNFNLCIVTLVLIYMAIINNKTMFENNGYINKYTSGELLDIAYKREYKTLPVDVCMLVTSLGFKAKTTRRGTRGSGKHNRKRQLPKLVNLSKLCVINAQSARNKTDLIKDYLIEKDCHMCAITETWFNEKDNFVIQNVTPKNYSIKFRNREHKRGGGVALIYRTTKC